MDATTGDPRAGEAKAGNTEEQATSYDVVVVGGGPAGLSGALALVRSRRSVLVIDAGDPRNAPAEAMHGFLTRDGLPPTDVARIGRAEIERYGGSVLSARVAKLRRDEVGGPRHPFTVTIDDGREVAARRLLISTGLVDELPDVPGLRDGWGRDVIHCPYCHGWEVRDQKVGVLATGPQAMHQAMLFSQLTSDVVLLLHHQPTLDREQQQMAAALGVDVIEGVVESLERDAGGSLTGARVAGGRIVELEALVVGPRFVARTDLLGPLGLEVEPHPMGMGEHVPSGLAGETSVPGVRVAGNVTDLMATVVQSAAAGFMAGARMNADLIEEDMRAAMDIATL